MATRRQLLQHFGLGAIAAGIPRLRFAAAQTDARLVVVILRGALDGLALGAPWGDPDYRRARGALALGEPGEDGGVLDLDGLFGLNAAMPATHRLYRNGEALLLHAVASPYRERSHFDGQDVLESGGDGSGAARSGWLNRALHPDGRGRGPADAIALAQNTPLLLRGDFVVPSWAPSTLPDAGDDTLRRLAELYAGDPFLLSRLQQALDTREVAAGLDNAPGRRGNETRQWRTMAEAAARFLATPDGPRIAVLETGGWDTHANQGTASGYLANRLAALDAAIDALRLGAGEAWSKTAVIVATEFGRTVAANGTGGSDHGTASAALLAGGAIRGGRVIADWPGLGRDSLFEARDLYPTLDLRRVFKSVLVSHLDIDVAFVERHVFPDSAGAPPLDGLFA